jgi:predicted Na+-dependent transporter
MLSDKERTMACWLLAGVIMAGFAVPSLSIWASPYKSQSLFLLIVMSLLPLGRLQVREVFSPDYKVWQVVAWQLLVLPALIVASAHLARISSNITMLMVTTAAAGSLFASPTFAELLQVNKSRALQCMVLSTFLMPLSYFIFFTQVLHANVQLDIASLVVRCLTYLVIPLGLLLVYMGISLSLPTGLVTRVESLSRRSTLAALGVFGLGVIGPARELLLQDPARFLLYLSIVGGLGVGMAYLTAVVMYRQGISDALTASIVSGFRNVGLGFVLLSGWANGEAAHAQYVGVSQIPIFLAPLVLNYFVRNQRAAVEQPEGEEVEFTSAQNAVAA